MYHHHHHHYSLYSNSVTYHCGVIIGCNYLHSTFSSGTTVDVSYSLHITANIVTSLYRNFSL